MKIARAGSEDSRSVSTEGVPSSKSILEDLEMFYQETTKCIRVAFPKSNDKFVEVFSKITSGDRDEVKAAISELYEILEEEKEEDGTTVAFMRLCGHSNLMNAMKRHYTCYEIQRYGCLIIAVLCGGGRNVEVDELGGNKGIAASLGLVGVFDRINLCLQNFRNDEALAVTSLAACHNLLCFGIELNVSLFLESIGIYPIVERMEDFPDNEDIQRFGCKIIRYCTKSSSVTNESLRSDGAFIVIGGILDRFPIESRAHKEAKKIMMKLLASE